MSVLALRFIPQRCGLEIDSIPAGSDWRTVIKPVPQVKAIKTVGGFWLLRSTWPFSMGQLFRTTRYHAAGNDVGSKE
jgi:hypothetical protein